MAITNLQLNVRANTARAMADFKRFSANLDNQFLVSGLKLDVVRNALSQINREFQKSIGEQGLIGASSLRAAQNQAAMMASIFKGFSDEASINITTQLSTALNNVAVKAGGTMKDVQRTLAATPFISKDIGENLRLQLTQGIMTFQRDFRRAGIGDNFAGLAQQFLAGQVTGRDLISTKDPISTFLGAEIIKRSNGQGFMDNPKQRSDLLAEIVSDPKIMSQLAEMAKRTMGFRIILEDLNTQLFNTESGVFGSLKKVIDRTGKQTTMFDEVNNLVEQVFGEGGFFRSLFKRISEIFKIGDPLRPLIDAVQFMTGIFGKLTSFVQSDRFKTILFFVEDTFYRLREFFTNVYKSVKEAIPTDAFDRVINVFKDLRQQITSKNFDPSNIVKFITDLGEGIREYIRKIGKSVRERDDTKEMGFVAEIGVTLLTEVGKTAIVLVKELLMTLVDKAPEIATSVLPALNKGINSLLTEAFGEVGGKIVKFIAGFIPGPVGMMARASAVGDVTGGGGSMASMLAMGAGAFLGPAMLRRLGTQQGRFATMNYFGRQAGALETRMNRAMFMQNMYGQNTFTPITGATGRLNRLLGPRSGLPEPQWETLLDARTRTMTIPSWFRGGFDPRGFTGTKSIYRGASGYTDDLNLYLRGWFPGPIRPGSTPPGSGGTVTPPSGGGPTPPNRRRMSWLSNLFRTRRPSPPPGPGPAVGRTMYTAPIEIMPDTVNNPPLGVSPMDPRFSWRGPNEPYAPSELIYDYSDMARYNKSMRELSFNRRRVRSRYAQRYGRLALMRRQAASLIPGGLRAGGLVGGMFAIDAIGRSSQAQELIGNVQEKASGFMDNPFIGGMAGGALQGAQYGMMLGPKGALAGAAIGAVIGGIAPLMDKGVREGVEKFISDIRTSFEENWDRFARGFGEMITKAGTFLGETLKRTVNVFVTVLNAAISSATLIPRTVAQMVQSIWEQAPDWVKNRMSGMGDILGKAVDITSYQIPTLYSGRNFAGPALALEARMSGRNPMVVNDGEFVIPSNGFATLAGLVGENLRNREVIHRADGPTQLNLNLTVQTSAFFADAEQIARELRQPVIDILDQAWTEYADSQRVIRSKTT